MTDIPQRLANLTPAQRQLLESRLKNQPQVAQPIAVVGMACRLPGAPNLDAYWRLFGGNADGSGRRHAFQEIPSDRWDVNTFYDPNPDTPGKMATRWMAPLENVTSFDAVFFGISPREAIKMDPQQRLLLEVSWEAIENAGIAAQRLAGTPVGVFVGIGGTDYSKIPTSFDNFYEIIDGHIGTGNALSIASNRISYVFDFRGPSWSVDTACSSGLVALHSAMQSLRQGECDTALAGGVNLVLSPEVTIAFSKARMLSPTGFCRPFDARADGYVRAEGCAMLVVKRLTDAIRDKDNILAIIRGSAVNQDGRTSGITAPNSLSQQACIRAALASAHLDPQAVQYIEAHGTGTPLGDPIEVQSLSKIFARKSPSDPTCYFGSVKANIGHTETVSGIAGLIKVIQMLQKEQIPAQFGLETLNPNIDLSGTRLQIPSQTIPWPQSSQPRVAGVSSFGFGGTNCHIILESASIPPVIENVGPDRPKHILAFSAKSKQATVEMAGKLASALETLPESSLADFCYSANAGRSHFHQRVAIVADSHAKLLEALKSTADDKKMASVKRGESRIARRPKVAFLFTGQGSQYAQMARGLYDVHPHFRATIDECTAILANARPIRLTDVLYPSADKGLVNETAYTQPALFAIEYALARLWQSWEIEPSILLGHSVGEYVAACVAGVLSLEDGLNLIAKRAQLMQDLPPNGTMAALFSTREKVEDLIRPWAGKVTVATANGPENNVISGETAAIAEVLAKCEKSGIGTQRLVVSHAFHSPLMDPMLNEFETFASSLTYSRPQIPIVANRTGMVVETASFDAAYWRDHLRNAVEFGKGMEAIEEFGVDAYLEVGPAATLVGMGKRCVPNSEAAWVGSLRKGRDDWETILTALRDLYVHGISVDWHGFDAPWNRRRITLPTYPFHASQFWITGSKSRFGGARGTAVHPLVGTPLETALTSKVFETRISIDSIKYLRDHQVQGAVIVPAAAYAEQGFALARHTFGDGCHAVENLAIQRGFYLPAEGSRLMQVTLTAEANGRATFETYSTDPNSDFASPSWEHHVTGTIVRAATLPDQAPNNIVDLAEFEKRVVRRHTQADFYQLCADRSLDYGPAFRGLLAPIRSEFDAYSPLVIPESISAELGNYVLHPAIGDAMVQLTAATIPREADGGYSPYTYIPTRISSIRSFAPLAGELFVYARRVSDDNRSSPEIVTTDLFIMDQNGKVFVECRGLTVQRVGRANVKAAESSVDSWLYVRSWEAELLEKVDSRPANRRLLVFNDSRGLGKEVAAAFRNAGGEATLVTDILKGKFVVDATAHSPLNVDFSALWQTAQGNGEITDVLYSAHWDCEDITQNGHANGQRLTLELPLQLLQHIARVSGRRPNLVFVTSSAQPDWKGVSNTGLGHSPLLGLVRVAATEFPEIPTKLVDLEDQTESTVGAQQVVQELLGNSTDLQIAYRRGERYVARLRSADESSSLSATAEAFIPTTGDYRLRIAQSGSLDGLKFESYTPPVPAEGQVEIEVHATGLNFSDVLKALGLYPGIRDSIVPLGIECSGVVCAIGPGVTRFKVGDEVMGVAPFSFASKTVTADYALVRKPAGIDHAEAATIPITFLTAYYGLVRLAQVQPGERILIHAGAGGVGLAAIQIVQHLGGEIFATAGSELKQDYLRSLGVKHVMSSRTLDFAQEILDATQHEGVDVVLNSLPGDAIGKSLSVLRAYGRFLEIGKTDIYSNTMIGLYPFQDNLSYFAIDLDRMLRQRPAYIQSMFEELVPYFEKGIFRPLPFTEFSAAETEQAFRYMAQRKNTGKVVVKMSRPTQPANDISRSHKDVSIHPRGTYLITGGLGALGLQVAEWLRDKGATHVALLARSAPSSTAENALQMLRKKGLQVAILQGDVANLESLRGAIRQIPAGFAPLVGVFHAAGVLDDGLIFDMSVEKLRVPLAPKIHGSLNLQHVFEDQPLELFVAFSSVASLLGSPGQANYAAANAFLDSFAEYRRSRGEAAISIQWGPWADGGMASEKGREGQLSGRGMIAMPSQQALKALDLALTRNNPVTAIMAVSWKDLVAASHGRLPTLLADITKSVVSTGREESAEDQLLRENLKTASSVVRRQILAELFIDQLARVTGLNAADVNPVTPLNSFGMDSLMAIELKNKIEGRLKITMPVTAFLQEPTVNSLSQQAAETFEQQHLTPSAGNVVTTQSTSIDPVAQSSDHGLEIGAGPSPKYLQPRSRSPEAVTDA